MGINLLDWKFWLVLIIVIILIRWLCVQANQNILISPAISPNQEINIAPSRHDPEEVSIAPSWIAPFSPSHEKIPSEVPNIIPEEYIPDLLNNGNSSVGEHLTSEAFKVLTHNVPIVRNARPIWLTNPNTGYALEMDVYCPSLACGIEYNGVHHYQYPNVFNKTQKDFENQLDRDLLKRQLADKAGIPIFTVPCIVDAVTYNDSSKSYVNVRRTRQQRYNLIYAYLKEQMSDFLISKGVVI